MNVALLNPPNRNVIPEYTEENFLGVEDYGFFPPLGILYIAAYLEKHTNYNVFLHDFVAEKIDHDQIKSIIEKINPGLVGITSFTLSLIDIVKVLKVIKDISKDIHICLGGPHAAYYPKETLDMEGVDSVIVGEGEIAFTELAKALENGHNIKNIAGLYIKNSLNKINVSKDKRLLMGSSLPFNYIDDLDSLPFPSRKFIKHINYSSTVGISDKLATIVTSRGCPYQCTFCDVPVKTYRERSSENVVKEVKECISLGYKEIYFYDDLFNITPKKVEGFCNELHKEGINIPWSFRGRINTTTYEMLRNAKNSGCYQIHFGVETGTDEGLEKLKKDITLDQIRKVFQWCRKLKIRIVADFMIGLPFEKNREDVDKNIDFLISLSPDYAQFSILTLYPYTQIFYKAEEKGFTKQDRWDNFMKVFNKDFRPDYWTEYFSPPELVEIHKSAYRKFYLRPSYIIQSLMNTRSFYELKTKLKGALKIAI